VRHTRFLHTCAALLLAATAACADGTGAEEPLNDVYVLATVDGASDPIVIADYTYPSGTRQVYMMAYDSLAFVSATALTRRFTMFVATLGPNGPITPVIQMQYHYEAQVLRRGRRVIVEYTGVSNDIKPDTFQVRDGNLVKLGPFGVSCGGCEPVRSVEYVYSPR
jgi:hypothetical protein